MSDYSDKILFGKNQQEKIVSLEVRDDVVELYVQKDDGNVEVKFEKNKFWILSPQPFGEISWSKLKGNQHYQYGLQFSKREDWSKFRYKNKDRDLYSVYDCREATMLKDGYSYYKGLNAKDVTVMSFDIETTGLDGKRDDAFLILISTTFRKNSIITKKLFSYDEYENEGEMISDFASYIRTLDPSILVGHNIIGYDMPYLLDRADANGVDFKVGRDGSVPEVAKYESDFRIDGTRDIHYKKIRIYGREIVDTFFLSMTMDVDKRYESYGLKQIIKQEGLEKKDRTFYDAAKIRDNYKDKNEFEKIKDYAIDDSDDALNLFDKIVPTYFNLSKMISKTFQEVICSASGGKLNNMLVRSYLQEGHAVAKASQITKFEGALSLGISGIHNNVLSFDVASLYPSIILEYKVFNKAKDPNGNLYYITHAMKENRLVYKKLYKETKDTNYDYIDKSLKVCLNSLYGLCGAPGLNYNCLESANFITSKGREVLKTAVKFLTNKDFNEWSKEHIIDESNI